MTREQAEQRLAEIERLVAFDTDLGEHDEHIALTALLAAMDERDALGKLAWRIYYILAEHIADSDGDLLDRLNDALDAVYQSPLPAQAPPPPKCGTCKDKGKVYWYTSDYGGPHSERMYKPCPDCAAAAPTNPTPEDTP